MIADTLNPWHYLGKTVQNCWDWFLNIAGEDQLTIFLYVAAIYSFFLNWIVGGIFLFFDLTQPKFIMKYKIQKQNSNKIDRDHLKKVITQVLINQLLALPSFWVGYHLYTIRGPRELRTLPSLQEVFIDITICYLSWEFFFYYSHRLLHTKYFYRTIHKIHHEYIEPIAITSQYCHPIEHIFSNLLPIIAGLAISNSHMITVFLWANITVIGSLRNHCGYLVPFLPTGELHDWHHQKFNVCFGIYGFLDWFHGTDGDFTKTEAYSRYYCVNILKKIHKIFKNKI